jgi:hypothetical protein
MVRAACVPALLLACACDGAIEDLGAPDASADAGGGSTGRGDAGRGADGSAADAPWHTRYDAALPDPANPPMPGEYPPERGDCITWDNVCFGRGSCDRRTGWCCNGTFRFPGCVCGATLGCQPPEVCCILPEASDFMCVPIGSCPQFR